MSATIISLDEARKRAAQEINPAVVEPTEPSRVLRLLCEIAAEMGIFDRSRWLDDNS
jgi:hypothetical protein